MASLDRSLPERPGVWVQAARREMIENKTIHEIDLSSASSIQEEQYLMLRVLRKSLPYYRLSLAKFGLDEWAKNAASMLEKCRSWTDYLESFSSELKEGTFALPRFYQKQVAHIPTDATFRPNVAVSPPRRSARLKDLAAGIKKLSFDVPSEPPNTPRPKSPGEFNDTPTVESVAKDTPPWERSYGPQELLDLNYPKTKDEQIVNTALIDFLNAFIIHRRFGSYWTLYRKPFVASFRHGSFEARTDGCLEGGNSETLKTYAIVEVKPMLRRKQFARIAMQEAAEMVAWIKAEPDPAGFISSCGSRVLVSQDRHEIYLTFAEYGANYVKYLNNTLGQEESPDFLTLHEFGPWDTCKAGDMKDLGRILLAIALRAETERCESAPKK
ncbi:hypothetical protein BDV32DRAFT_151882 [Aspergillus pseudonomiae]|uniref:Uncharacterized protein n=1 Tax=Aspergillus pseudonomiae TaxID=1506151 RepID=A0A5N6HU05_9EURO|nr:uncharacterized protein BDV37DRAFT_279475 [Aspergillus pseudonomiae]KAB8257905.1 hypothetical protein BDV32DRAFT_151882 [Aspergillus pseudonomiae]KAE8408106.1 hypothetical protein BDV37DRAFT_279475 [Aspergillus pseudonomiae]